MLLEYDSSLDHAEPLPAFVDGPEQRVHQLLVAVVVRQAELVEARVRRGECPESGGRGYLESRVQLLRTDKMVLLCITCNLWPIITLVAHS